jgi:uncharacterized membrane protein
MPTTSDLLLISPLRRSRGLVLEIWGQWSFQSVELRFHGIRNLAYMLAFACLGWTIPKGGRAIALILLLACELLITLWDFVEEDRTRHLPATERVTHTLLTLNYGVILAMLIPLLLDWAREPSLIMPVHYGIMSGSAPLPLLAYSCPACVTWRRRAVARGWSRQIPHRSPPPSPLATPCW